MLLLSLSLAPHERFICPVCLSLSTRVKHKAFKANVLRDAEENAAKGMASQKAQRKQSSLYGKHVEKHAQRPSPFSEVLMSQESISEGGVGGDLYFSCRDDAIVGHVLVSV